jgi:hypothetical protein
MRLLPPGLSDVCQLPPYAHELNPVEIARLARLVDGEHAFPLGLVYSRPGELGPGYQLTFTPASASRPTAVVDPGNCMGDGVFADGVRQPGLVDAGGLARP